MKVPRQLDMALTEERNLALGPDSQFKDIEGSVKSLEEYWREAYSKEENL
jgi:hypothetical protein